MRFPKQLFSRMLRREVRHSREQRSPLHDDRLDISEREAVQAELKFTHSLEENLNTIRAATGPSTDVAVRRILVGQAGIEAAVVHIDTLAERDHVQGIIRMLGLGVMETPLAAADVTTIRDQFKARLLQATVVYEVHTLAEAWSVLSNGGTLILFSGDSKALACNTEGFKTRAVEEPAAETSIRGPRTGFIESIGTNISLLRQTIRTPNLWFEDYSIGHLTRTRVSIAYIKGLATEELIQEVRQRITSIETDAILESGYVEEFIEDNPYSLFPLVFRTERPDRIAAGLLEGRVAILVDNTSFALMVPMDLPMLLQAPDDYYEKIPIGSFLRVLRTLSFIGSIVLPGSYVAIITFHQELMPTSLLLTVTAAREGVPFPVLVEVLIMELLFELLREAGVRLPRAIGPAVTIVGALVLGEAAISAGFVSPSVVIVVALTAIASFTVPTFSFGIAARLARFAFILLGGTFGLFGVQFGALALLTYVVGLRSFGHPFAAPAGPLILSEMGDLYWRSWLWSKTSRPKLMGGQREPIREARGQMPSPAREKEEVETDEGHGRKRGKPRR